MVVIMSTQFTPTLSYLISLLPHNLPFVTLPSKSTLTTGDVNLTNMRTHGAYI
jgi:hypothetical protein